MAVRQKQKVLDMAYKHFSEFGLPLDIDFKSYTTIVGAKEAIHPMSVKRSFKNWKYILHALRINHPELAAPKPEPEPVTPKAPKPKAAVKPAIKPAVIEDKDDE